MVRGSVSLVANETRLTDEVFAANVAFLRENIDQMFVLLMGAITCFLQVLSVSLPSGVHFLLDVLIS